MNGTGALVGPLLTAPLMSWISPTLFYWTMGAYFSVIVGFISYRILFREALPKERERAVRSVPGPGDERGVQTRDRAEAGDEAGRQERGDATSRAPHRPTTGSTNGSTRRSMTSGAASIDG